MYRYQIFGGLTARLELADELTEAGRYLHFYRFFEDMSTGLESGEMKGMKLEKIIEGNIEIMLKLKPKSVCYF